jgi:sulfonate transport system substrate-binding protein
MSLVMKAAAAVLGIAVLAATLPASADPLQIRIGWNTAPTHIQPLVDELQKRHPEIFPHFGKTYVAEGQRFNGSTTQISALAIGELEIASLAPSGVALAVNNAHLELRIVADVFQDGKPGYGTVNYVVRAGSDIRKVEDLKGHNIATNAIGSFGDSSMRVMFRKHGLADTDITSVEVNFANMPAMLDDGKVDLINLVPQSEYMLKEGKYRLLFTAAEAQGVSQAQVWAMRADTIAAHRAAFVDFFADHIGALRWLLDPAHHAEAIAIAVKVTKADPEAIDYVFTARDEYRSPDAAPDLAATQRAVDNDLKLGVIPKGLTVVPKYVDLSLVEEAKKRVDGR